jgi:hypothetical protein
VAPRGDPAWHDARVDWTHLVTLDVSGQPASTGSAHEESWTDAVREAVVDSGVEPAEGRFSVRLEFRLTPTSRVTDATDLHHLVGPTVAGLDGVVGTVLWAGEHRPLDDRIDHLEAWKRQVEPGEEPGVSLEVWVS